MFFRLIILVLLIYFVSCNTDLTSSNKKENSPPIASLIISPDSGDTSTLFKFDASATMDNEDSTSSLEVRWDWENNGFWDTRYSTKKIEYHKFRTNGLKSIALEVKDTGGLLDTIINYINISSSIGDYFPLVIGNVWTYSFYYEQYWSGGYSIITNEAIAAIELFSVKHEQNEINYYLNYELDGEQIYKYYHFDLGRWIADTTYIFVNDTLHFIQHSDNKLINTSSEFFYFNLPRYKTDGLDTLVYGGRPFEPVYVMVKDIGIIYYFDYDYTNQNGYEKKWDLVDYQF